MTLSMVSVMTPLARPIVRVLFERRAFGAPASGLVSSLVIRCLELLNFLVLHM